MIYVFLMFSALVGGGMEGETFCCTDRAAVLGGEGDCIKLL